jgi:rSAM/selenodomain-associated transferase 1
VSAPPQVQVLVLAKEPVAGRVKTRLCPPLTPEGAARLAAAALADTLDVVRAVPVARRVLVLDGVYGAEGFDVQPQRGGPMHERLAAAFDDAGPLPALLIGMDTPQLTPALLAAAVEALVRSEAVIGTAPDGGWWALGLQRPDGGLLLGIPTSQDDTGSLQLSRLAEQGLTAWRLPELRDVDTIADAHAAAALAPGGRFALELARQTGGGRG